MNTPLLAILFGAIFVNNIVLMRFLGLCPFFGVSTRLSTAIGMSSAVLFVMTFATWITWGVYHLVLVPGSVILGGILPQGLVFLRTVSFILVIASLVQLVEMFLKKFVPVLYSALGIYLPLITTNCAILGVAFLVIDNKFGFLQGTIFAIGTALGFGLVMVLFAAIRERLELAPISKSFRGYPIAFIAAALVSIAFFGFVNMFGISP
ncbi:electron transport complex subunit RsxA [candidate division TA06 bacterium B3_TA06]|uniref:Ion-translocating oxidoreductase complex subunit A n=1 Tax=candidate division TA06 bacterium B3_TA06 TaxID=2012487 RepID=A0A532V6N7_UNCT6|nr:MAG: RnfABCDGE type electron transport complex subunit A [Candidatus Stahlbacteria bacterium]TKJ42864.1 MAG: electron transport complex subunit RsxA [candidate division TA06 bacterium B3_TA06]